MRARYIYPLSFLSFFFPPLSNLPRSGSRIRYAKEYEHRATFKASKLATLSIFHAPIHAKSIQVGSTERDMVQVQRKSVASPLKFPITTRSLSGIHIIYVTSGFFFHAVFFLSALGFTRNGPFIVFVDRLTSYYVIIYPRSDFICSICWRCFERHLRFEGCLWRGVGHLHRDSAAATSKSRWNARDVDAVAGLAPAEVPLDPFQHREDRIGAGQTSLGGSANDVRRCHAESSSHTLQGLK